MIDVFLIYEHDGLKEPINVEIIKLLFVFVSYIEDLPYHIHHIDKNPDNNSPDNLMLLCPKCHREIHKT
ncbi:MAG: HNH endonuclease [Candidatus Heimdallarchaeota archaeon]